MIINNKYYNQIEIFNLWLEENKDKFINKPIIFEESDSYLTLKYENIIDDILIRIDNNSAISVIYENSFENESKNLISDFFVVLKENENNKYFNEGLSEENRVYYHIPELVYYDEYNLFLKWSNDFILKDNYICIDKENKSQVKIISHEEYNKLSIDKTNLENLKILSLLKS
ncbi:MAG: hypothetical protein U0354_18820 [Candidatus Sericytochromatia bacterium]